MAVTCRKICDIMEGIAPGALAMDYDNVGLLVGDLDASVDRVLVALEVTQDVIDEAVRLGADMIVTHHPLMLRPVGRLTKGAGDAGLAYRLAREGICHFAAHTNLDIAPGGVNDALAARLGLKNVRRLQPYYEKGYRKLVVFVPPTHAQKVREALFAAGAGRIGAYGKCSFSVTGRGTFEVPKDAKPYLGAPGNFEQVEEIRLETIVPGYLLDAAVAAMLRVHPYEAPAYDVYALEACPEGMGLGRAGDLTTPMALSAFARLAARALGCEGVRVAGDETALVACAAVCGGSGNGLVDAAARQGAGVFVTGELKHSECLHAAELGVGLILAGHYSTEAVVLPELIRHLQNGLDTLKYTVELVLSGHSHELRWIGGE